jgi:hypothetical protein
MQGHTAHSGAALSHHATTRGSALLLHPTLTEQHAAVQCVVVGCPRTYHTKHPLTISFAAMPMLLLLLLDNHCVLLL